MPNRTMRRNNARMQEAARQRSDARMSHRAKSSPAAQPNRSSIGGLNVRLIAPLCYLATIVLNLVPKVGYVAFVVPLIVFFIETRSAFVRFHALQAALFNGVMTLILMAMGEAVIWIRAGSLSRIDNSMEAIGALALLILMMIVLVVVMLLMFKATKSASREETYRIPVIGRLTERVAVLLGRSTGR